MFTGNDVVDLVDPRKVGRADDDRFVRRILDPSEAEQVAESSAPDLELWHHWAAKEVAFKVISKMEGSPPPFVHAAFVCEWSASLESGAGEWRAGMVRYEGRRVPVRVRHTSDYVHGFGWSAGSDNRVGREVARLDDARWQGSREELEARLTGRERDAVHSTASAAVRLAARAALSTAMGVEESRLEIVCAPGPTGRRPPLVMLDGQRARADVSLAHDGAWIAWSFWVGSGTPL